MSAWVDGFRRVGAAPAVVAGVCLLTLLTALPLGLTMRGMIREHLGRSLVAGTMADAVDYDWWQEFVQQTSGPGGASIGGTFTPSIIGAATTLDGLSGVLEAQARPTPIVAAIATYLLGWMFVSGGILDRYARQRRTRAYGFFAACGVYVFRFLRLGLVAGLTYWFLYAYLRDWLFTSWYAAAIRSVAEERVVFAWRLAMYAIFGAALLAVNLLIDYAKVRIVVEDRRSAIGALSAALAFLIRNPLRAMGLYAANALTFLVVFGLWALVAPDAGRAGLSLWLGVVATQFYLVARLVLKLQFLASQTALFQQRLAHARYAAAPEPAWPESPAGEAIAVGRDRGQLPVDS